MWPAPGEPRAEVERGAREIRTTWTRTTRALDDATAGEHFALVALRADRIDHLSLREERAGGARDRGRERGRRRA